MLAASALFAGGAAAAPDPSKATPAPDAPLAYAWEPVGLSFIKRAPHVIVTEAHLPATPQRVFAILADPKPWPRWLPLVSDVQYRKPMGLGTERDVTSSIGPIIRERFFHWDEGERFSFSVSSASSPAGVSFLEDYVLKPVRGGTTHLVWTTAFSAQWWATALGPAMASVFTAVGAPSMQRLAVEVSAPA